MTEVVYFHVKELLHCVFSSLCECAGGWVGNSQQLEEGRWEYTRVGVGGEAPRPGGVPGVNWIPNLSTKQHMQSLGSFFFL